MLLVIPASSLTPQIDTLAKALKARGPYPEHSLRVITSREDEELGYRIGDELSDSFRKVTTETLAPVPKPRNPVLLANHMLMAAVRFLEGYKYAEDEVQDAPMLYFHPGYRPAQQGWLNDLQAEFFLKGAPPMMGRTQTFGIRTDKNVKNPNTRRVTVGPVIFGRKCLDRIPLLNYLDDKEHWRSRMVHELASGMTETKQIGAGGKSLLREMPPARITA